MLCTLTYIMWLGSLNKPAAGGEVLCEPGREVLQKGGSDPGQDEGMATGDNWPVHRFQFFQFLE